jgi:hypothetical protein
MELLLIFNIIFFLYNDFRLCVLVGLHMYLFNEMAEFCEL